MPFLRPWLSTASRVSLNFFPFVSSRTYNTTSRLKMDYENILKGKYPAKAHAKRVVDYIRSKVPDASGVLYLESRLSGLIEDSDEAEHFRYTMPISSHPFHAAVYLSTIISTKFSR